MSKAGTPRVSVVMASYNHEAYVREALESALGQTFQDLEIVVTDDGSTDGTADVVRSIEDPRISLTAFERNKGACIAGNDAISRARGEYLSGLSSDDAFLPEKLAIQVAYLDSHPDIGAVFGQPLFVGPDGSPLRDNATYNGDIFKVANRSRAEWLRHFFVHGNCICHPTIMIRRKCFEELGLFDQAFTQLPDLDMWVRLLTRYDIHIMDVPLTRFRILDGMQNVSAPRPDARVRLEFETFCILRKYLALDEGLLLQIFHELKTSGSTKRVPVLARVAHGMLGRLAGQHVLPSGVPQSTKPVAHRPVAWQLAELALRLQSPAHVMFALQTMQATLPEINDAEAYRAYASYTGAYDIFGILRRMGN